MQKFITIGFSFGNLLYHSALRSKIGRVDTKTLYRCSNKQSPWGIRGFLLSAGVFWAVKSTLASPLSHVIPPEQLRPIVFYTPLVTTCSPKSSIITHILLAACSLLTGDLFGVLTSGATPHIWPNSPSLLSVLEMNMPSRKTSG